jgi:hypothetical protein
VPATSEHRRWPIWYVPADAAADGFGGIARFVVPRLLERDHANVFTPGVRGRIEASTREGIRLPRIEADKSIMQLLWWTLKSQRIAYARPPWNPGEGQEIRSPAMLLCRNGRGTCVDLAVLLAGVCLNEGLDVLLVMLCTEDEGHVGLAIRLGRSPGGTVQQLYGTAPTGATGVSRVKSVERLCSDGNLLLIDPTIATADAPDRSLDAAINGMHALLKDGGYEIHLVDVTARQRAGDRPLDDQPVPQDGSMVRAGQEPQRAAPGWMPQPMGGVRVSSQAWSVSPYRSAPPSRPTPPQWEAPPNRRAQPNDQPARSRRRSLALALTGITVLALVAAVAVIALVGGGRQARNPVAGKSPRNSPPTPIRSSGAANPQTSSSRPAPTPGSSMPPTSPSRAGGAVPAAPTRVKAADLSQYKIEITWARQPSATGFHVSNGSAPGCPAPHATLQQTTGPGTYATFNVTPGTCQCFHVEAIDGSKTSDWSTYRCAYTQGIKVHGHRRWTQTRVFVQRGQWVYVTASGYVNAGQSGPWGPEGSLMCLPASRYPSVRPAFPAPQLPCWSLIARVGNGPPFKVGSYASQRAASSGRLYLGVNDSNFSDNSGDWMVGINLGRHPPRP